MLYALLMMACGGSPPPEAAPPEPVALAPAADTPDPLTREELETLAARVEGLDERLARVELLLGEMQEQGLIQAEGVGFNPSHTRMDARDVQTAIEKLYGQIQELERRSTGGQMGHAGEGLFQTGRQGDGPKGPANPGGKDDGPYGPGGKREGK